MNKPNSQQIAQWKEQFGNVYTAEIEQQSFIFRSLTFRELHTITTSINNWNLIDLEDYIVNNALLSPDISILDDLSMGAVSSLAEAIRDASGLEDAVVARQTLENARAASQTLINMAKVYILATMPYKEEDLDDLTATKLFHKIAIAEQIINLQQQVMSGNDVSFYIIDPEEEEKKRKEDEEKREKRLEEFRKRGGHFAKDSAPPLRPSIKPEDPIAAKLRKG